MKMQGPNATQTPNAELQNQNAANPNAERPNSMKMQRPNATNSERRTPKEKQHRKET